MAKKVLVTILGIIILVALVVWVVKKQKPGVNPLVQNTQVTTPQPTPEQTHPTLLAADKLPAGFPANIPLEAGAKVTQNFTTKLPDGGLYSERVFITAKTPDANFKLYSDYFKKNGFAVLNPLNQPTVKILSATKGTTKIQLTLNQDAATKSNMVTIIVTQTAK